MKWIPNFLSLFRGLIIAPALFCCSLRQSWKIALTLLVIGAFTDGLDGFLAGKFNARTWIGKNVFDPIADGMLLVAAILGLIINGKLSWWLIVIGVTVGLFFRVVMSLASVRVSRFAEGLFPFWGISCGLFLGGVFAFQAFNENALWLILPAIAFGLVAAWLKRGRLQEAINNIRGVSS